MKEEKGAGLSGNNEDKTGEYVYVWIQTHFKVSLGALFISTGDIGEAQGIRKAGR